MVMGMLGPEGDLQRRVSALEAQIQNMLTAGVLQSASSTNPDGTPGIIIQNGHIQSSDFDGNMDTGTQGAHGWGIGGLSRDAFFNQIGLANGIIGNNALSNPVMPLQTNVTVAPTAFTTTAGTVVGTATMVVPAGFTSVALAVSVIATGGNPLGVSDNLWGGVSISGAISAASLMAPMGVQSGLSTINSQQLNRTFTGLTPGSTIIFSAEAWTSAGAWPSSANNAVILNATGIFFR